MPGAWECTLPLVVILGFGLLLLLLLLEERSKNEDKHENEYTLKCQIRMHEEVKRENILFPGK